MLKSVAVGAAALAIVGSSIVYAQQRSGGPDGVGSGGFGHGLRLVAHYRPSIDDMKAFTDARIAALKAGLQLTPDQDKNWPPFEQALRDLAKLRIDHMQARLAREEAGAPQTPPAPFERLAKRADAMAKRSAALKQLADTGAPLYQSLSDAQKERFKILAHSAASASPSFRLDAAARAAGATVAAKAKTVAMKVAVTVAGAAAGSAMGSRGRMARCTA